MLLDGLRDTELSPSARYEEVQRERRCPRYAMVLVVATIVIFLFPSGAFSQTVVEDPNSALSSFPNDDARSIRSHCRVHNSSDIVGYRRCTWTRLKEAKAGPEDPNSALSSLPNDDARSIRSHCRVHNSGDIVGYRRCTWTRLKEAKAGPEDPNSALSSLPNDDARSIRSHCRVHNSGDIVGYRSCTWARLKEAKAGPEDPNSALSSVPNDDARSIRSHCRVHNSGDIVGYRSCTWARLKEAKAGPEDPNSALSSLPNDDARSIRSHCRVHNSGDIVGYRRCTWARLKEAKAGPEDPNSALSSLPNDDARSIRSHCRVHNSDDVTDYRRCIWTKLAPLGISSDGSRTSGSPQSQPPVQKIPRVRPEATRRCPSGRFFSRRHQICLLRGERPRYLDKEMVKALQAALTILGHKPGAIDGVWGPRTIEAIIDYRKANPGSPQGRFTPDLFAHIFESFLPDEEIHQEEVEPKFVSSGSGFWITSKGHIATNFHVVKGCKQLKLDDGSTAQVVGSNQSLDIAVIKTDQFSSNVADIRPGSELRSGEKVVVAGFPLHGLLATQVNISVGIVSATAGLGNDPSQVQISAPIQSGNSGGPLLDARGNIVGVIVSKLDVIKVSKVFGDVPQNINFGVKSDVLIDLARHLDIELKASNKGENLSTEDVARIASDTTVLIKCWK